MILHELLLQILHYLLLRRSPILLKPLPVLLLLIFQLHQMLHLDILLPLLLILHVNHEFLLFARVIDPLVDLLLVDGELVQASLHAHHLQLLLLALVPRLHHLHVGVAQRLQTRRRVESLVQSVVSDAPATG